MKAFAHFDFDPVYVLLVYILVLHVSSHKLQIYSRTPMRTNLWQGQDANKVGIICRQICPRQDSANTSPPFEWCKAWKESLLHLRCETGDPQNVR